MQLRPFRALRPRPELAARIAAVPYDVVDRAEAKALAEGEPLSFLHVTRSEIDLPPEVDAYDDRVYARAREAFDALVREEKLIREDTPSLYAYLQEASIAGQRVRQLGVVGCCAVDDYARDVIKKHEVTRKAKEDDRTRHVLSIDANAGPVFLTYRRRPELDALLSSVEDTPPLYDFTAPDGVRHAVWKLDDAPAVVEAFGKVDVAYVADGHHRAASAARAGAARREQNPSHRGDEEYNYFLCVLFASDQLNVLPYHRVVRDLNGQTAEQLLARLGEIADVAPTDEAQPSASGSFGMYLAGHWYRVTLPADSIDRSDPIASLDYVLLTERILGPLLGVGDLRTDPRIDFVGGARGTGELKRRVDSGEHAIAFAMVATDVAQLMAVADAGQIMPPKSTWFEPKLRSGLLVHTLS